MRGVLVVIGGTILIVTTSIFHIYLFVAACAADWDKTHAAFRTHARMLTHDLWMHGTGIRNDFFVRHGDYFFLCDT